MSVFKFEACRIRVDEPEGGAGLEMEMANGDLSRKRTMDKVTVSVGGDSDRSQFFRVSSQ
jgi:hypothetical protein